MADREIINNVFSGEYINPETGIAYTREQIIEEGIITEQGFKNMDLNFDGVIDTIDRTVCNQFFSRLGMNEDYTALIEYNYEPGLIVSSDAPTNDDVVALAKILAGESIAPIAAPKLQQLRNADINGDGKIDAVDLWLLMQMVEAA